MEVGVAVKLSSVKFQDVKCTVLKCKHEIFVRIDMKDLYFSNYFIICLKSVVEIIIELFVVCQKLIHLYAEFLFLLSKERTNLTLYLFIEISYTCGKF